MKRNKKNSFDFWVQKFFWALCLAMVLAVCVVILNSGLDFSSVPLLVIVIIACWLGYRFRDEVLDFIKRHKKIIYVLGLVGIVMGLVLRFLLIPIMQDKLNIAQTLSDTGTHWYGAQQLLESDELSEEVGNYEAMFPYLFTYTGTLAVSMRVFGANYSAVVILNVLFDLVGGLGLYMLFKKWKNKKVGLFAVVFWMINPLEIIFCALPLAIVIVNVLFILSALCVYMVYDSIGNMKKVCLYSILLGIVLAIGNAYRPFFIIFAIALAVYFATCFLRGESAMMKQGVASLVFIFAMMFFVGLLFGVVHKNFNSYYHGEKSQAGWSMFVGANYESKGKWNSDDRDYFFGPVLVDDAKGDVSGAQSLIVKNVVGRYGEIILQGNLMTHIFNKIGVLFGDVRNSIYDIPYVFGVEKDNSIYNLVQDLVEGFYLILLWSFGVYVFRRLRNCSRKIKSDGGYDFILIIAFVGFFCTALAVEVMNRYSLPFITLMSIVVIGYFGDKILCGCRTEE